MSKYEILSQGEGHCSIATPFGVFKIAKASSFGEAEGDYFLTIIPDTQLIPQVTNMSINPEHATITVRFVRDETR